MSRIANNYQYSIDGYDSEVELISNGKCRVAEGIGSGSFGIARIVRDDHGHPVAVVKQPKNKLAQQELYHSFNIAQSIGIPVSLFTNKEIFSFDRLIMPYEGVSLYHLCSIYPNNILKFLLHVAQALVVFHEKKYMHGDLKETNIVSKNNGKTFHLIDYDYSNRLGSKVDPYLGSADYLAPELFANQGYKLIECSTKPKEKSLKQGVAILYPSDALGSLNLLVSIRDSGSIVRFQDVAAKSMLDKYPYQKKYLLDNYIPKVKAGCYVASTKADIFAFCSMCLRLINNVSMLLPASLQKLLMHGLDIDPKKRPTLQILIIEFTNILTRGLEHIEASNQEKQQDASHPVTLAIASDQRRVTPTCKKELPVLISQGVDDALKEKPATPIKTKKTLSIHLINQEHSYNKIHPCSFFTSPSSKKPKITVSQIQVSSENNCNLYVR